MNKSLESNLTNDNFGSLEYPVIRAVEAFPVETEQGQSFCIRDPQNIAQNPLVLPPVTFLLISLMDGSRSVQDIQTEFFRQTQQNIPADTLIDVLKQLDDELYLDSERFHRCFQEMQNTFLQSPIRESSHAGTAYETGAGSIKKQLDVYFQAIENVPAPEQVSDCVVSMLISPHIDLKRGGLCFAHAYREIQSRSPADLYVILGTGHQSRSSFMTCTKKTFRTPLGEIETDREFVEQFSKSVPIDVFEEEFIHRDEHSIEFQVLFLQHILGDDWNGKIVPILCGSFHKFVQEGTSPRSDTSLADSLDVLRRMIHEYDGTVAVVAGVDMSHVGKRFGQEQGVPPDELERVMRADRDVLDALLTGKAETFYRSIECVKDCNNVCGLTPVYMGLDIVQPQNGIVLNYDKALENEDESVVTFASAAFYDNAG